MQIIINVKASGGTPLSAVQEARLFTYATPNASSCRSLGIKLKGVGYFQHPHSVGFLPSTGDEWIVPDLQYVNALIVS